MHKLMFIGIEVSEAREAKRSARTRPAVPLNIAARSLLLYTWRVFVHKSKLAPLLRAPHPDARRKRGKPRQAKRAKHSPNLASKSSVNSGPAS
jgi:hypothetical protein